MTKRLREFSKSAAKKNVNAKGYETMKAMQRKPTAAKSRKSK